LAKPFKITARSVHERLQGRVDPELHFIVTAMAEEIVQLRQENKMLAAAVTSVADGLSQMTGIIEDTDKRLEKMRRTDLDDQTSPYVTAVDPKSDD
jgi:hypothetical protein